MLELDLSSVEPSIAGPKRPQDRIALSEAKQGFFESLREFNSDVAEELVSHLDKAGAESFPASDPPADEHDGDAGRPRVFEPAGEHDSLATIAKHKANPVVVKLADGEEVELDHGRVVISSWSHHGVAQPLPRFEVRGPDQDRGRAGPALRRDRARLRDHAPPVRLLYEGDGRGGRGSRVHGRR